ncbi:MAG: hypothetical protein OXF06_09755 [Bacteroidetes bacterium]|nr:hypothetical protein [Bacteroidota bacterium]
MKGDQSDIMVFIDLGFVLLVGFLILSETAPLYNVALPGSSDDEATEEVQLTILNLHFSPSAFLLESQGEVECQTQSFDALIGCMEEVNESTSNPVFVLIPEETATVQHLVALLDLCEFSQWQCSVEN